MKWEGIFIIVSAHSSSSVFLYGRMHASYRNRVLIRCTFWVLVGAAGKNPVVSEPVRSSKPSTPRKAYAAYDWGTSGGEWGGVSKCKKESEGNQQSSWDMEQL